VTAPGPLPELLPREVKTYAPQEAACAECGGAVAPAGKRCLGSAGVRTGTIQGDPAGATEAELSGLRAHRAGSSTESSDRARRESGAAQKRLRMMG
jgi:hypothetical protein